MNHFFFYSDPASLQNQLNIEEAFGPLSSDNDIPQDPTVWDRYHITNIHNPVESAAPAIAVCDGKINIQFDDNQTCTLILKPFYQPSFDFPFIKYFLFKGIDIASVIDSGQLKGINNADPLIPFVSRIKKKLLNDNSNASMNDTEEILGKEYTSQFQHDDEAIFSDDSPIDNIFYYPNSDFELPIVRAGELIGHFESKVGFEIVLERLGYEPPISLARTFDNIIRVEEFTGQNPAPNDADYFEHWHKKEECLNYIDPSAFYGSFAESKLLYRTGTNLDREKANTTEEVHTNVLSSFKNKNRVYFDIRDDFGFSLSYYEDKVSPCTFKNSNGNTATPNTNYGWPVSYFEYIEIASAGEEKRDFFYTNISINSAITNRIVYLSRANVKRFKKLKRKHRSAENPSGLGMKICLPTVEVNNNYEFISNYFKINCYDISGSYNTERPLAPVRNFYLDSLFSPTTMKQPIKLSKKKLQYSIWHQEQLVDLTVQGGSRYVASVGIAQDNEHTTLFAIPEFYITNRKGSTNALPKELFSWTNKSQDTDQSFILKFIDGFQKQLLFKKDLSINNGTQLINLALTASSPYIIGSSAFDSSSTVDDYCFLVFNNSEYQEIFNTLTPPLGSDIQAFIYLVHTLNEEKFDDSGTHYQRTILDGTRLEVAGQSINKKIIPLGKEVFENANRTN